MTAEQVPHDHDRRSLPYRLLHKLGENVLRAWSCLDPAIVDARLHGIDSVRIDSVRPTAASLPLTELDEQHLAIMYSSQDAEQVIELIAK